jgi:hypothetical protein
MPFMRSSCCWCCAWAMACWAAGDEFGGKGRGDALGWFMGDGEEEESWKEGGAGKFMATAADKS